MIVDKLCNLELYSSVVPEFTAVADFLRNNDIASFEEGSYEIVPGVKLNISEYEPYAIGDKWEVHRRYADLQMVLCGDEKMDCKSTLECVGGEYNGYYKYLYDSRTFCIFRTSRCSPSRTQMDRCQGQEGCC